MPVVMWMRGQCRVEREGGPEGHCPGLQKVSELEQSRLRPSLLSNCASLNFIPETTSTEPRSQQTCQVLLGRPLLFHPYFADGMSRANHIPNGKCSTQGYAPGSNSSLLPATAASTLGQLQTVLLRAEL